MSLTCPHSPINHVCDADTRKSSLPLGLTRTIYFYYIQQENPHSGRFNSNYTILVLFQNPVISTIILDADANVSQRLKNN